jgi:DNA adenine methylase
MGELFMYCTALLAPLFWVALTEPPGDREFPSKVSHMVFIGVINVVAAVCFALMAAGKHLNPIFTVRGSGYMFKASIVLLYLGTVYRVSLVEDATTEWLGSLLPLAPVEFGTYYEPFLGGGALFFALQPANSVLSDKNEDLITTYTQVRNRPELVIRALKKLRNTEDAYYEVRARQPGSAVERAARLVYLTTLSFNGIHRVNLRGFFNVPYGFKTHLKPCEPTRILEASRILRKATLFCQDFEETVKNAEGGDFVYLDPPYTTAHSSNGFVKYNAKIFTWDDQRRLSDVARKLAQRGCTVMVSNGDHSSIRSLYKDFEIARLGRYSIIAASRSFRRRITECVFYNHPTNGHRRIGDRRNVSTN